MKLKRYKLVKHVGDKDSNDDMYFCKDEIFIENPSKGLYYSEFGGGIYLDIDYLKKKYNHYFEEIEPIEAENCEVGKLYLKKLREALVSLEKEKEDINKLILKIKDMLEE